MTEMLDDLVEDKRAWTKETFDNPDKFIHTLPLNNLSVDSIDSFIENELFQWVKDFCSNNLQGGFGFGIVRGIGHLSEELQRRVYLAIVKNLGVTMPQNILGDLVVDVTDKGKTMLDGGRYHETKQGGSLHTDSPQYDVVPDYIGLLCIRAAEKGGESKLVSAYSLHNMLLQSFKPALIRLYSPFHFDRRGDGRISSDSTTYKPIFQYDQGDLRFRYLSDYVRSGSKRFGITDFHALDVLDSALADESLMITFKMLPGDIQFINNHRVIHGRNEFEDGQYNKRLMIRTWVKKNE